MKEVYEPLFWILTLFNLASAIKIIIQRITAEDKRFKSPNSWLIFFNVLFFLFFRIHSSYTDEYFFSEKFIYFDFSTHLFQLIYLISFLFLSLIHFRNYTLSLKDPTKIYNTIFAGLILIAASRIVNNFSEILFNRVTPPLSTLNYDRIIFYIYNSQVFYWALFVVSIVGLRKNISEKTIDRSNNLMSIIISTAILGMIYFKIKYKDYYSNDNLKFIGHFSYKIFLYILAFFGLISKRDFPNKEMFISKKITIESIYAFGMISLIIGYKYLLDIKIADMQNNVIVIVIAVITSIISVLVAKTIESKYTGKKLDFTMPKSSLVGIKMKKLKRNINDKCKILFLSANPVGTAQLLLDNEVREIEWKLKTAKFRDSIELVPKGALRPDDLLQYLNENSAQIIHFSGHGTKSEELMLIDENNMPKAVSKLALVHLFKILKGNIKVVLLNACYSRSQAEAITSEIDIAIGMKKAIGDKSAITFAASFYRAISFGKSVQEAFDQGIAALLLENMPDHDIPELIAKNGVNPNEIRLVSDV